jgi:hypothetical protein
VKRRPALLFVLLSCALATAEEPKDPYPLAPGKKWTYSEKKTVPGQAPETQDVTFEVQAEKKKVKELDCTVLKATYADGRGIELCYAQDKKGLLVAAKSVTVEGKVHEVPIATPELFLRLPLKAGHRWRYAHFDAAVVREEEVTVPAGKFKAFRVEFHRSDDEEGGRPMCNLIGTAEEITMWLAPGTGVVKETFTLMLPNGEVEAVPSFLRELKTVAGK